MIKKISLNILIFVFLIANYVFSAEKKEDYYNYDSPEYNDSDFDESENFNANQGRGGYVGQYGELSNPVLDRARAYLLEGVVKNAMTNYGNFISWDEHPGGLWGEYTYLPHVGMIAGVPGCKYSHKFEWYKVSAQEIQTLPTDFSSIPSDWSSDIEMPAWWESQYGDDVAVFCSEDAYEEWAPTSSDGTGGVFADVVFDNGNHLTQNIGDLGDKIIVDGGIDHYGITGPNQWSMSRESSPSVVCVAVNYESYQVDDPNKSSSLIGLVYPWAKRQELIERRAAFDFYDYGPNLETWDEDDNYVYYGPTVSESWFTRTNLSANSDWQATQDAKYNTHATEYSAGDLFGDTPWTDSDDPYPLLAHSNLPGTWPEKFNLETGEWEQFWPGWYAQKWDCEYTDCYPCSKKNDDCWYEDEGRFISDVDAYMEFDDRWASLGNTLTSTGGYDQRGYPMGLKVKAIAHTYGVAYAEDVMFVSVLARNESGDWYDHEDCTNEMESAGACEGMIMPDGTKLNNGMGFDYKDMSFGFYMDADVLSKDIANTFGPHTNGDDFMEYYVDVIEIPSSETDSGVEEMRISMAIIGDYDGQSGFVQGYSMDDSDTDPGSDFGLVAVQFLDSPVATQNMDLNNDGFVDVYVGDKMKMTDWHWFDWYNRPGVVHREASGGCCAGDPGKPQAFNKEEIQYKVMVGDTTNLSRNEKEWFFHADPLLDDLDPEFNPHFDSVEDLKLTSFFTSDEDGLDCVLKMTTGPFDLAVGEEANFSFCILFGQNKEDLIANAEFAQIMYNNKYQGYTAPKRPKVVASYDSGSISLHWNDESEYDKDVVTGYSDFEGYKIYKSTDGGVTWGTDQDKIYDDAGILRGWRPLRQYDLTAEEDINYCVSVEYLDQIQINEDGVEVPGSNGVWDFEDVNYSGDAWDYINCLTIEGSYARNIDIQGADPHAPWFSLGADTGLGDITTEVPYVDGNGNSYKYTFTDNDVIDGMTYTYSVTSYDMGVSPSYNVAWNESQDGFFTSDTTATSSNPLGFSNPGGYNYIENSKGTTTQSDNFVKVVAGARGNFSVNDVLVYPNPYIVSSGFNNESPYQSRLRFVNVPQGSLITIYTITGEEVFAINSEDQIGAEDGNDENNVWWDLRTVNNQEVAPGLYLFTVENNGQIFVGKFAVVR